MILTIPDRIVLLQSIPKEGDILTIRILRTLREALSFTEAEHEEFSIVRTNFPDGRQMINWDMKKESDREINIGPVATEIIINTLKVMNDQKKLTEGHIRLWEMFCAKKGD